MKREELRLNSEKYKFREFEGITLISLVITMILLIILAGIVINLSIGENGIFNKAKYAKEETNKQVATEKINLKITTVQINKYTEKQEMPTLKELSEVLRDDNEIQYVTESSKVASAEYDVPSENPASIYTKLNQYPYEFEINSSLQLASIDGVKIATNVTPSNTPSNSQNTMSSQEHFIREYYYNGKPIYAKTLNISSLPNKSMVEYEHGIKDADIVWIDSSNSFVYFNTDNGIRTATIPQVNDSSVAWCTSFDVDRTKICIFSRSADKSDYSAYITLKYTKTTDTGNKNTIDILNP